MGILEMKKKCCCFGHRYIYTEISSKIEEEIVDLIENKNVSIFYTGGMGDFDRAFCSAVRKIKHKYTWIKLNLVKPYFTKDLNVNKDFYQLNYDSIIIPEELMDVHYKSAIKWRNRWMVDNSNFLITYVYKNYGGAYEAVSYAKKKNKEVINLAQK